MAKISAYGEREVARWRFPGEQAEGDGWVMSPQTLVLTGKPNGKPGRLLRKYDDSTGGYTVLQSRCSLTEAEEYAARRGFVR